MHSGESMATQERSLSTEEACPYCGSNLAEGDKYCSVCGYEKGSLQQKMAVPTSIAAFKLVVEKDEFLLQEGEHVVGRTDGDIIIANPYLSRKHARLRVAEGRVFLTDLGSTNGTFLDGERLKPGEEREITVSSKLRFAELGASLLRASEIHEAAYAGQEAQEPSEEKITEPSILEEGAKAELAEVFSPWQVLVGGEVKPLAFGQIRIGRKPERNDIAFPEDRYVSGEHLILDADLDYLRAKDLNSTNGTIINGKKIEPNVWVDLADGDEIKIGQTSLKVRRLTPPMEPVEELQETRQEVAPAVEQEKEEVHGLKEPCEAEGLDESDEPLQD